VDTNPIVLYGAGDAGRWALKYLKSQGEMPVAFADNDPEKQNTQIEGVPVLSPNQAFQWAPVSTWVACTIQHKYALEMRKDMARLGVPTKPLWQCLPTHHGLPPRSAEEIIIDLLEEHSDEQSIRTFAGQLGFREEPDYDEQADPVDISEIYFPEFIHRREDEHFLDCGAAMGDTIKAFIPRWLVFGAITALEPDPKNFAELKRVYGDHKKIVLAQAGVSDHSGIESFVANGDWSSHLNAEGEEKVVVERIDHLTLETPPTYIKMDVEGAELHALWGARETLKKHMPVLAVCAYHTSDHLWEIPLLIHAIQPDYRLFFRRYAEGAFEIVWYAVPPERVKN
jgi:FkbM family methyltransferase